MRETKSTCPYCGVGCGVIIESDDDNTQITGVRGDPDHPANFGRLCTKGSSLHLTAAQPVTLQSRLLHPLWRRSRGEAAQRIGWDDALDQAADRIAGIVETHGADAVGLYISGQLLTEDYYVFNKLAKGLLGTNNIDTNSRLCMSSAVAGYKATLGADAPPACYDDVQHAHTIFIAGSNTAWAHPVLFRRIEDAKRADPQLRLVVVDPRRTETAELADLHLPLLPGSDVALFHGMLHVMLWEGWCDDAYIAAHTHGFDALKRRVRDFTPHETARLTGLDEALVVQAAREFAGHHDGTGPRTPTLSLYCQGLNQSSSGTAKNAALINLHLATGQIGKRGAGPFSLTGQPNAMGGREVGGMANLLGAHRDLANAGHRAEVAALWGVADVPSAPGKTAVEMFEAAADGEIKALWIACTNPAQSMPDQATVRRALQRAEFVLLQEAFAGTATARFADLLLPATTWGEKDGTVTNSERCISRVRTAVGAPGEARHDWRIAVDVARRLERRLRPGCATLFDYAAPEAVWNEHRDSTRGRDLDITGMSYALLERAPQQWPMPFGAHEGRRRLYEDGRFPTADGRASFFDTPYRPVAEPRDARFAFSLNTGRLRDQWHGMSRTGLVGRLFGHAPEPSIDLHPGDFARLGLHSGDLLRVSSRRGWLILPAAASSAVAPAQAFIAMHWGDEFVSGAADDGTPLAGVNALIGSVFCPISKQPELKHAAVQVEKVDLPWRLLGVAWLDAESAQRTLLALRPLLARFAFATCVPFGHAHGGVLFRAADRQAAAAELLDQIESAFALQPGGERPVLRYDDRRRGTRRAMRLAHHEGDDARLDAFLLAGDIAAEAWLKPLLQSRRPARAHGMALLIPGATPRQAVPARGRQICTCFDVSEDEIRRALSASSGAGEERLPELQQRLRCGTQCGSCVPELRRLLRRSEIVTA